MQPIRATHRISRTQEGELAWRTQALPPAVRSLLGLLRTAQTVSDILRPGHWSPADLENTLGNLARSGWVLIQEPELSQGVIVEVDSVEPLESGIPDDALEQLLSRHRLEEETRVQEEAQRIAATSSVSPRVQPSPPSPVADHPMRRSTDRVADVVPVAPAVAQPVVAQPPVGSLLPPEIDNVEELPFDANQAVDDGLINALRNPVDSSLSYDQPPEWAPPSGGLAALLRALGEEVPEGVDISPDQHEHLNDIAPLEPWGSKSASSAQHEDSEDSSKQPFARLRDQPSSDGRQKARLGALHESLGKVQREEAASNAARDRARQVRDEREAQLKKVHAEQAQRRKQEEKGREGTTLIGLSQKLARVKNNRDNNE